MAKASEIIVDIESTVGRHPRATSDRCATCGREDSPHATWALLFYSLQCRFDYWLRHVPPEFCWEPASRIDEALEHAVTLSLAMGPSMGDGVTESYQRILYRPTVEPDRVEYAS